MGIPSVSRTASPAQTRASQDVKQTSAPTAGGVAKTTPVRVLASEPLINRVMSAIQTRIDNAPPGSIRNFYQNFYDGLLALRAIGGSLAQNPIWDDIASFGWAVDGLDIRFGTGNAIRHYYLCPHYTGPNRFGYTIVAGLASDICKRKGDPAFFSRLINLINLRGSPAGMASAAQLRDQIRQKYPAISARDRLDIIDQSRGYAQIAIVLSQKDPSWKSIANLATQYTVASAPEVLASSALPNLIIALLSWSPQSIISTPPLFGLLTYMAQALPALFGGQGATSAGIQHMQALVNSGTDAAGLRNLFHGPSSSTGAPAYIDFGTFVAHILSLHPELQAALGVLPALFKAAAGAHVLPPPPPPPGATGVLAISNASGAETWSSYENDMQMPVGQLNMTRPTSGATGGWRLPIGYSGTINLNASNTCIGQVKISHFGQSNQSIVVDRLIHGVMASTTASVARSGNSTTLSLGTFSVGNIGGGSVRLAGGASAIFSANVSGKPHDIKVASPVWAQINALKAVDPHLPVFTKLEAAPLQNKALLQDAINVVNLVSQGVSIAQIKTEIEKSGRGALIPAIVHDAQVLMGCSNEQIQAVTGTLFSNAGKDYRGTLQVIHDMLMMRQKLDGKPADVSHLIYEDLYTDNTLNSNLTLVSSNMNVASSNTNSTESAVQSIFSGLPKEFATLRRHEVLGRETYISIYTKMRALGSIYNSVQFVNSFSKPINAGGWSTVSAYNTEVARENKSYLDEYKAFTLTKTVSASA